MGKKQHSKDRLFITQTEHKYLYGGKHEQVRRAYRRLPFNCCAITLCPFKNPVATRQGHLFDIEAIVPYIKQHQINPVTGKPMALKDLIQLHFRKNSDGAYFCPVTYKVFTDNTKIAAIATTGNVFAYDAVDELNIKPKNWTDLISGEPFKRKDIIVLQDPQDTSNREIDNFEHFRRAQLGQPGGVGAPNEAASTPATKNIRTNAATNRVLQELEAKRAEKRIVADKIRQGSSDVSEKDKILASLLHSSAPPSSDDASSADKKNGEGDGKATSGFQFSRFTTGDVSRSFTSSARAPVTESRAALASTDERNEKRWQMMRKLKKKGLVRLETTLGDLNLEIHCDFVPQTADNFMSLCSTKYYDGVLFHRIIKGFMMQGGDPTGTGTGGESIWKKPFRDEIDSRLSHDERGVVSMANAGPGTNRSQFFITFKACTHLDKKHAVFGRVVGGMETLDKIERVATGADDRPLDEVKIVRVHVFANPFDEYDAAEADGTDVVTQAKQREQAEQRKVHGTVVKIGNDWVAYDDLGDADVAAVPSTTCAKEESVGKYLEAQTTKVDATSAGTKRSWESTSSMPAPVPAIEGKKKAKSKSGGFGDFANWMEKYVIDKVIGEGTYGIVYKAREKGSQDFVAIKKFKTVADEQLSKREIQACSMLSHPYIVSYRHSFRHEGLLHLVFDYVCDSMFKMLSRNRTGIKPTQAQRLIYQLCQALHCCHSNHIIHRDVKPENILMDEHGNLKLCDFGEQLTLAQVWSARDDIRVMSNAGVARTVQFAGDPLSDYVATRWYRPPEQELRMDRYSFDADIWSVGCVLMELLTGRPLFPGNTQIDQINMIQEFLGPLPSSMSARVPRGVKSIKKPERSLACLLGDRPLPEGTLDFIHNTLQLDPANRLSAAGCLSHPFLRPLRDAEMQERKRQKQARALEGDDGIEEEIPGEKSERSEKSVPRDVRPDAKSPIDAKLGPRSFDFKLEDAADAKTPDTPQGKDRRRAYKKMDNNTEVHDGDDIQEIIECEDAALASVPRSKGARRRRHEETFDPLDAECYEDDFEDYHA
ncbi:TPA: hypothetical protein N0F65_004877 [Lagenidium giganteum]|uniref:RING-type E3 ubiquitin transferase n=1 Tax=Lagenidium giganteum TaxID=4803 RepID=A0AAV2Z7W1_9STRA|nr:TPA: hypothetical protein N0F65_004877 [Lagenidium giganteum]